MPAVLMDWLKTLKITLRLAKRLLTFWATLSGDSKHRQVLSHGTRRMCTKRALPEGKAFFQPPEAAAFSERLAFLTPIAGVGWRAEGGRGAGWQLKSCNFSTGFLRKPGLMSNLGADKTETQSLSWALVSCRVTWTTHPAPFWHLCYSLTHFLYPEEKQGLLGQSLDLHSQWSQQFFRFWEFGGTNPSKPVLRWSSFTISSGSSLSFISVFWLIQCLRCKKELK